MYLQTGQTITLRQWSAKTHLYLNLHISINPSNNTPEQKFQVNDKPRSPTVHDCYHKSYVTTDDIHDGLVFPQKNKIPNPMQIVLFKKTW